MPITTTTSSTSSPTPTNGNNDNSAGPTSSPLLFFVALGFGVVFTNLWIIVGVKYCFRYNQRSRHARALGENGDPIDLAAIGGRPHRRRREKKLMSMEEVNERFPLTKYKTWRSTREAEGLPAAGGVTAPPSRAASLKNEIGTIDEDARQSADTARPNTAIEIAQQDHINATAPTKTSSPETTNTATFEEVPIKDEVSGPSSPKSSVPPPELARNESVVTIDEEDEDDPIRTAAPPEMLAVPGDTCAICLDTLDDDDDVRGLTCGHAFHAACVDPWLTSRRACCPLCKADYYVPKPRADGEETETNRTSGRRSQLRSPQTPSAVWIGRRTAFGHPRLMFAGPRFFLTDEGGRMYAPPPSRQERRRREQDVFYQDPAAERQQQQGSNSASGWRSRIPSLPAVRLPRFARRGQQSGENATAADATSSPANLEAGNVR